ncbi:MAG: RnfABCDGE type electron transport complex subunit G [Clostridia bacterium]|nr:RnfABCDGE type electron transport complex subunit G [Clostridia bacterium]
MRKTLKFLYPTFVLAAICLIVSLALSVTNAVTKDKIAEISNENTKKAMSRVLEAETYTDAVIEIDGKEVTYYKAVSGGEVAGYIFITAANGYGGEVRVMTAVLPDKTIKAVEILDVSSETPGLGQNSAKEGFYGQFAGKRNGITVVKSGANSDKNEIDAVTGATITSRAVTKAVNEALDCADEIIDKEAGETSEE